MNIYKEDIINKKEWKNKKYQKKKRKINVKK